MVLKGSKKLYAEFFKAFEHTAPEGGWTARDRYDHTPEQIQWFLERGCEWEKVCLEPGDMVLFDSVSQNLSTLKPLYVDRLTRSGRCIMVLYLNAQQSEWQFVSLPLHLQHFCSLLPALCLSSLRSGVQLRFAQPAHTQTPATNPLRSSLPRSKHAVKPHGTNANTHPTIPSHSGPTASYLLPNTTAMSPTRPNWALHLNHRSPSVAGSSLAWTSMKTSVSCL